MRALDVAKSQHTHQTRDLHKKVRQGFDELMAKQLLSSAKLFESKSAGGSTTQSLITDVLAQLMVEPSRTYRTSPSATTDVLSLVDSESARISSGYGERIDPISHDVRHHHGVDIAAPEGATVRAATTGVVSFAGDRGGYGQTIEVTGVDGRVARYAHLSAMDVQVGDRILAGEALGAVGSTGRSTGSHLHFEIRNKGLAEDPRSALRGSEVRADDHDEHRSHPLDVKSVGGQR